MLRELRRIHRDEPIAAGWVRAALFARRLIWFDPAAPGWRLTEKGKEAIDETTA